MLSSLACWGVEKTSCGVSKKEGETVWFGLQKPEGGD